MLYLDTEEKTVTVDANTTLTLAQLWSLVELMDDDDVDEDDVRLLFHGGIDDWEPQDWVMSWVLPAHVFNVRSYNSDKIYCVVRLEDDTWSCSCPDYIMRRHGSGDHCKHIRRMYWGS